MQVRRGEGTRLSLMLLRNGTPWTGRSVSVRVVAVDGTEFTASTPAPETSEPGLYSLAWTAPPTPGQYKALWTEAFTTWAEEIEVGSGGGSSGSQAIYAVIADEEDALVGKVTRDENLAGVVGRDEQLTGKVGDDDNVVGTVGRDEPLAAALEEQD